MRLNFTASPPLILVLLISLSTFSVHAEESPAVPPTDTEQTKKNPDQSGLAESRVILANIKQLNQETSDLREVAAQIPGFDQLLFTTLLIEIEGELSGELDHLISIQQKLDKTTKETQHLLKETQALSVDQEKIIRYEIVTLKNLFPKLHKQADKNPVTDRSIDRAKQLIFGLLGQWQKNIDRQKLLNMSVDASTKELKKLVHFVAITQTARIRLSLDAITELNIAMEESEPDEQKEIARKLHHERLRKALAASTLEKMLGIMAELNMDTTKFGQALVIATGNILHTDVKTKAVIGLFKKLLDQAILKLQDNIPFILFRMISFIFIILAFKVIASIARKLIDKATSSSKFESSQLLKDFLGSIIQRIVMIVGFIIALSQLGIEIGPLLAGMGIMGFVVGFALQDTLSNFASGLMILFYRPFDVGNLVDVAGISGKVKEMNLVSTTILTFDRKRMIIPNSKIWGDIIINITAESVRRVDLAFSIGHHDNINIAEQILHDIVDNNELTLKKPEPTIKLHAINESSVDFIVRPWVKSTDYWSAYWDITRQVKERFDEGGLSFPYPQRDVHIFHDYNKPNA